MTPRISLVAVCCSKRLLEFFEQSHVLDSDHRLIGKGFDEADLLFGKRMDLLVGEHG